MAITRAIADEESIWHFGDRLRKARRDPFWGERMDQNEFAAALDVSAKVIPAWESGINAPRNLVGIAMRVSDLTGYTTEWLLGIPGSPAGPKGGQEVGPAGIEPATKGLVFAGSPMAA